jgi:cytochrome c-type biogenesis protein CcmH
VKVHVSVSTALKARAAPDDTVFVFARAVQGPKAPLAIQRLRVRDLPVVVTLDDSTFDESGVPLVYCDRGRDRSANQQDRAALAQPGDLQAMSPAVAVGAHDVRVEIAEVVK